MRLFEQFSEAPTLNMQITMGGESSGISGFSELISNHKTQKLDIFYFPKQNHLSKDLHILFWQARRKIWLADTVIVWSSQRCPGFPSFKWLTVMYGVRSRNLLRRPQSFFVMNHQTSRFFICLFYFVFIFLKQIKWGLVGSYPFHFTPNNPMIC